MRTLSNAHQYIQVQYNPICKIPTGWHPEIQWITSSVAQVKDFNSAVVGPKLFQQRQSHSMEFLNGFYCNNLGAWRQADMAWIGWTIYKTKCQYIIFECVYVYTNILNVCMITMQIACVTYNAYLDVYKFNSKFIYMPRHIYTLKIAGGKWSLPPMYSFIRILNKSTKLWKCTKCTFTLAKVKSMYNYINTSVKIFVVDYHLHDFETVIWRCHTAVNKLLQLSNTRNYQLHVTDRNNIHELSISTTLYEYQLYNI